MNITQKATLHNEFTIDVHDVRTGELKNTYKAYNIILNQGFDKIIANFQGSLGSNNSSYFIMRPLSITYPSYTFGGAIHVGTGTGNVSPERTQLFNFIYGNISSYHEHNYDFNNLTGYYTQKIIIEANKLVGENITEVGLASNITATYLSTHALIKDSEGNTISINKTAFDVITIYSKVYIKLTNNYNDNFKYIEGIYANFILSIFTYNGYARDYSGKFFCYIGNSTSVGNSKNFITNSNISLINYTSDNTNIIYDMLNKKINFYFRYDTYTGNGYISEIGFGIQCDSFEKNSIIYTILPVFRSVLPITGVWDSSTSISNEEVDTGDGVKTEFNLVWNNFKENSQTIKIDALTTTDYTINTKIGNYSGRLLTPGYNGKTGNCVSITSDNQYVAVGLSQSPYFELYKINVLSGVAEFVSELPDYKTNFSRSITSIAFSPDNSYVVAGDSSGYIYIHPFNISTGVIGNYTVATDIGGTIRTIQFTNDSKGIVIGHSSGVQGFLFDTATGTLGSNTISLGLSTIYDMALSKDNEYLILGYSSSPYFRVYKFDKVNITLGVLSANPATLPSTTVTSCTFTHDNKYIVLGLSGASAITIYPFDPVTGVISDRTLGTVMPGTANSLALSDNSRWLAVGLASSPYLKLYNFDPTTGTMGTEFSMTTGLVGQCYDVILPNDNIYMITAQSGGVDYYQYFNIYPFSSDYYHIKFNNPPGAGLAITATYDVDYIPKDVNHVLDISFDLQFADGNI